MLRAGAVPLPDSGRCEGNCSISSLAVRELWPVVAFCGAKSDRDCVMAYNLYRVSLGFSDLLLSLNVERKWYRRSSSFSLDLVEFG